MIVSRDSIQGLRFMENNLGVALQYVVDVLRPLAPLEPRQNNPELKPPLM